MYTKDQGERNCRICLEENAEQDWDRCLVGHENLTYKECYYKYTHLDDSDEEKLHLPTLICRNCSENLKNIHAFVSKAIEIHDLLKESIASKCESTECKTDFETVLITQTDDNTSDDTSDESDESISVYDESTDGSDESIFAYGETSEESDENMSVYNDSSEESDSSNEKVNISVEKLRKNETESVKICSNARQTDIRDLNKKYQDQKRKSQESIVCNVTVITPMEKSKENKTDSNRKQNDNRTLENIYQKEKSQESDDRNVTENGITTIENSKEKETDSNGNVSSELQNNSTIKSKFKKRARDPICCSICSKVLKSKYSAIQHEKTHIENRERNETCKECGMKFYNKRGLRSHMQTHVKNREKTKKCEFCDKSFYAIGALNVHRRIHLGQMVKCNLCTKEFCRQIDLDKHLRSHSSTKISIEAKQEKKYFISCEFCGENVRSFHYKPHLARHKNEPQAKCAICNKEFFSRKRCASHIAHVHKKEPGKRACFIIANEQKRFSSKLFQHIGKKVIIEQ